VVPQIMGKIHGDHIQSICISMDSLNINKWKKKIWNDIYCHVTATILYIISDMSLLHLLPSKEWVDKYDYFKNSPYLPISPKAWKTMHTTYPDNSINKHLEAQ
jgi:hypothetical protein